MRDRMLNLSERWFRLLQRLYPSDFRDEMGNAVVEAYMDRARMASCRSIRSLSRGHKLIAVESVNR
jgi:hypothetical protein